MAKLEKEMKEEADLVYEIMGVKKSKKSEVTEPKESVDGEEAISEVLFGKKKPKKNEIEKKLSKQNEELDLVNEIWSTGKSQKNDGSENEPEKKPKKKNENFGI